MAQFNYKGRDASGVLLSGVIEAQDSASAAQVLINRKVIPLDIVESEEKTGSEEQNGISFFTPKVSLDDLVIFSRQMYSLTRSGIPLLRAIHGLSESTNSPRMKVVLSDVVGQLEHGRTLSTSMHQHPSVFNRLFVSIVHVGENTGKLDEAFMQLAAYLEREQETRKQIKAATRYPLFVIFALVVALVIMNIVVIPVFASMFTKFGAELPAMTRFLLAMSHFFVTKWPYLLVAIAAIVFFGNRYLKTPKGSYRWDKTKIALPLVGSIFERTLLGRFSRSFSMMLRAGVPLTSALDLVAEAVGNDFMEERIRGMRQNIEKGESLSRVASSSALFTPLVLQMISVGEETGRVDELLQEVAEFYEREVDYDLKSLTSKIEPILITLVAGMVLVLALGIFTPMWDMMSAAKGKI
jgi:MSHA biogenesis protein MshG